MHYYNSCIRILFFLFFSFFAAYYFVETMIFLLGFLDEQRGQEISIYLK